MDTTRAYVVCGGPTAGRGSLLWESWLDGLQEQVKAGDGAVVPWHDPTPDAGRVDGDAHVWRRSAMRRVGYLRQQFLDFAFSQEQATHALMVDDDVILGPGVLMRLLMADAPVAFGVYWTTWPAAEKPMPQVWDRCHPYGLTQGCYQALEAGQSVQVVGGGGVTLIRRDAWPVMRYWPPVPGLPDGGMWQGEDRHACVRAGAALPPVRMVAVGGLTIRHCYSAEQRTDEAARAAWQEVYNG